MAKTGGLTEMKQKSSMGNSMVTTSGNPDSRTHGEKISEGVIASQITKPINWKSDKYYRKEFQKTPEYKQYMKEYMNNYLDTYIPSEKSKQHKKKYLEEYYQRPEVKKHVKEYESTPERKEQRKKIRQTRYAYDEEVRQKHLLRGQKYKKEHKEELYEKTKEYYAKHPERHNQVKADMKRLREQYYSKGTTKKQANVERHLEAKKKLGFSHIELEKVI
jgi:hypothetical protein